ncbi:molybdopterin-containing oxidoreductase family protein [Dictyobacter aurantiacus]|nr:molybdopterin-dependent oxidoreductase [Dictyobacter aurantiacus]
MAGRRVVTTMCPMNCTPTQCGMKVEVAPEENRVISVKGDTENPDSRGFLCVRGRAAREIFENPKRLLRPMRRVGERGEDRWEPCSWDEAYALIVESIQQTRPERVGIWRGHGSGTTGPLGGAILARFGMLGGFQNWNTSIVCWAMGGYGLGLTGALKTHTKEDMAANSRTIVLWGATLASQPDLGPHLVAARKRGAYVVQIDTRRTEVSSQADEVILLQPGSDAAMALALAHVIIEEGLHDREFVERHTLGFAQFAEHVRQYTPEWASAITGVEPGVIRELARRYATTKPAMIVLGGSSIFKHQHGWEPARAIPCLPALTGQFGIAGGGLGQRHGASPESVGLANPNAGIKQKLPAEQAIPSHMTSIAEALGNGQLDVLLLLGSNILSSFSDSNDVARGLERTRLIVSYDLFMNETSRRYADLVLPATAWLETIGIKQTATHIYLMERALQPEGECRPLTTFTRQLGERLGIDNIYPWKNDEEFLNTALATQKTEDGHSLTVEELRRRGGYWLKNGLSHIAYQDHQFHTPSQKIEFWSERAQEVGLPPLPTYTAPAGTQYPLRFSQGRTLTAFHAFFDEGQALPTLARVNPAPELWINPQDADKRQIESGATVVISNQRGQFTARANVTTDVIPGAVWMRDGWSGVNRVTSGAPVIPLNANDIVPNIPGGQAAYDAWVEVNVS